MGIFQLISMGFKSSFVSWGGEKLGHQIPLCGIGTCIQRADASSTPPSRKLIVLLDNAGCTGGFMAQMVSFVDCNRK